MCSGRNKFPSWWYDDCFGYKKERESDKKEDKCYGRSCLCEDLSSFTIEYPSDNFDSIYTTQDLEIKTPASLRFLTKTDVGAPDVCQYTVSFIDESVGTTLIYEGFADNAVGPELVDL